MVRFRRRVPGRLVPAVKTAAAFGDARRITLQPGARPSAARDLVRRGVRPRRRPAGAAAWAAAIAAVAVLAGPVRLPAQAAPPDRTSLTGLTLSAPQQAAIRALGARTHAAIQGLYAGAGVRPGAPMALGVRDSARALMAEHNAALRALLTADQRAAFEANVQAVAAAHRAARADSARHRRAATAGGAAPAAPAAGGRP